MIEEEEEIRRAFILSRQTVLTKPRWSLVLLEAERKGLFSALLANKFRPPLYQRTSD